MRFETINQDYKGSKYKFHTTEFESIDDMISHINDTPRPADCFGRSSDRDNSSNRWDLYAGFKGSKDLIQHGWTDGTKRVKEVFDKVAEILKPEGFAIDINYAYDGGAYVDIDRYISGEPEHFVDFRITERQKKIVDLVVNATVSYGVSSDFLVRRGAAICATVDVLEQRGYQCNLYVVSTIGKGHTRQEVHNIIVPVKYAGQPVDIDRLSFCIAHPAMFRRLMFAVMERAPKNVRDNCYTSTYGSVRSEYNRDVDIYFDDTYLGTESRFKTPDTSAAWVKEVLIKHELVRPEEFAQ